MWQNWIAIAGTVPMALQSLRRRPQRDVWIVVSLLVALGGVFGWGVSVYEHAMLGWWPAGLSSTILASAITTLALFAVLCLVLREAWRLTGLVGIYSLIMIALAALWQHRPGEGDAENLHLSGWVIVHIATALPTYALVTLAAIAALAAYLQQAALKQKRTRFFSRGLPALADCDAMQMRLLQMGEIVLALGLTTGMALEYVSSGRLLDLNHKTVLTLSAFIVIGAMLIGHQRSGLRGRRAAQLVLLGYLLLTLGYPGVKFVTDVLISPAPASGPTTAG